MKFIRTSLAHVAAVTLCIGFSTAQNCTSTISATSYPAPSLADGWGAHIIANGFVKPRSMKLDYGGHLLVVDQDPDTGSGGIWRLTFEGEAPCLTVSDRTQIIANGSLNHGIEFNLGTTILYASSQEAVYAWDYEPETGSVTSDARRVINLGGNGSHATRTLLMPASDPDYLLVSWGSDGNVDPQARDPSTGYSTVKAFNMSDPSVVWNYAEDGLMVGWGLRNSVGLAQNPLLSGIWSNENSVDDLTRDGEDIVEDNPAEELNFHGFLSSSDDGAVENSNFGGYYGYPDCYPAWDAEDVPNNDDIVTGQQFAANFNASIDDEWCAENTIDPVLSFTAHMAPMDMEFTGGAETLFITFRGSWNRENPAGYKLAAIPFSNETGMPIASPDSREGYVEIMTNEDLSACPDECFRPVGLEWSDYREQLFMAADASGEIYIVYRTDGSSVNDFVVASAATGTSEPGSNETTTDSSAGDASATPSSEGGAQSLHGANWWAVAVIGLGVAYLL